VAVGGGGVAVLVVVAVGGTWVVGAWATRVGVAAGVSGAQAAMDSVYNRTMSSAMHLLTEVACILASI